VRSGDCIVIVGLGLDEECRDQLDMDHKRAEKSSAEQHRTSRSRDSNTHKPAKDLSQMISRLLFAFALLFLLSSFNISYE